MVCWRGKFIDGILGEEMLDFGIIIDILICYINSKRWIWLGMIVIINVVMLDVVLICVVFRFDKWYGRSICIISIG